jgi:hypothetical protein
MERTKQVDSVFRVSVEAWGGCPLPHLVVVLVAVDAAGFLILLFVESLAIGLGEVAVVLGAHTALFFVDASFLMLEV